MYAIFGTSKDISVGPTAILSLVVASNVGTMPGSNNNTVSNVDDVLFLAFFAGLIQIAMGLLKLGEHFTIPRALIAICS